ncbi:Rho termination factor N-terminal domain-containing protein [Romboutsia sp. MSSM.1001216sp_RTP31141st1_G3_RTP31141_220114]|uniref:Rho termination factor N-terminal domain-containing protein n=1 Tax=unclassified Romboutsia TaxID=2626894 RepID=UPI0031B6486A
MYNEESEKLEMITTDQVNLKSMTVEELKKLAKKYEIDIPTKMNKTEIIELLRGVINGADAN